MENVNLLENRYAQNLYETSRAQKDVSRESATDKITDAGTNADMETGVVYDKDSESFTGAGTYTVASVKAAASTTPTNQEVQSHLSVLGLYNGPIDGNLTSTASKKAIKNFQQVYCDTHNSGTMTDKMKTKLEGLVKFRKSLISDSNFNTAAKKLGLDSVEKSNLATTWTFLRKRMGLTAAQTAGVCGSIAQESKFATDNLQNTTSNQNDHDPNYAYKADDEKGYGLMQWTVVSEKKKLETMASNMGLAVSDLNAQLAHIQEEMTVGVYKNKWPELKKKTSYKEVCQYFTNSIEGAGTANLEKREQNAEILYNNLKQH